MKDVGTVRLETDRLILRRLEMEDASDMFNNWCNDLEVTRQDVHENIEVTKELLEM